MLLYIFLKHRLHQRHQHQLTIGWRVANSLLIHFSVNTCIDTLFQSTGLNNVTRRRTILHCVASKLIFIVNTRMHFR